ncbi:putative Gnk2-like domain-containing protein [Arabidopsis thaliana]
MSLVFGSVHILAMIAIQLLLIHSVSSLNLTNAYLHHKCSNTQGKYKQGSAFEKNLNLVLSTITSIGNFRDGFRYTEEGEDPNNVFVMFQCRGDSYWSKCPPCISTAVSGLRRRCPRNKGAIIWYDQCLLKISSVASFNKIDYENDFYLSNPKNMSDRELFNKETSALLEKLANKASDRNNLDGKQLVLYAAGEKRIGTKKVSAMVQCTKDLIFTKCFECLEGILRKFPECCDGKQGGRVLGTSCNFRYELYPFLRN